jgi:hypothetical protein
LPARGRELRPSPRRSGCRPGLDPAASPVALLLRSELARASPVATLLSSPPVIAMVHAPAAPPDRPRAHPHVYCTPGRPQRAPLAALLHSTRELPCLLSERPSNQLQTPWDPARTLAAGLSGPARGVGVGPGARPPERSRSPVCSRAPGAQRARVPAVRPPLAASPTPGVLRLHAPACAPASPRRSHAQHPHYLTHSNHQPAHKDWTTLALRAQHNHQAPPAQGRSNCSSTHPKPADFRDAQSPAG